LEDIRNTRKIRAVVLNGRYLDRAALDKLLAVAAASAGFTHKIGERLFLKRAVTVGKNIYGYRVYMPENFDAKKAYPVVLILHGAGARGDDNERQTFSPLGSAIRRNPRQFDAFIAVFPQARENTYWIGEMVDQAVKALEQTVDEFKADPRRLYLTGNSLGGYGAWYTVAKYPGKFAALVPVSGGIFPLDTQTVAPEIRPLVPADMLKLYDAEDPYLAFAKMIGKTPTWIFHGSEDQTVPVSEARNMAQALRAVKGDVRFTEYAGEGHGVGAKPYADAELWKWLLAQRLGK
ncbi:MAG: prolyl oligopeptidase family serine peptidase, partial [Gammaproteobacteria bacterium]